ncbi:hypothetical protein HAX54_001397 [Datura stramonium]|uniref:Uncharacterized protein n=1 Tax=Datura stramonium TaxID=4076 RepID=A0ABS8T298_DATST|nr:hypothetical protein [Datura stramonium]
MVMSSSIEKSFRIKHEENNKFLSKLLSKENSKAAASIPSFRVYYNDVPSSVPFIWELQPGTPKHTFPQTSLLPPLTPPPSYYSNTNNTHKKTIKNNSRSKKFHALIMKLNPKKSLLPPSPSYSSSSTLSWSSSSQYSSISAPATPSHLIQRRRFCCQGSSFDDYNQEISPASKFCFGNKAAGNSVFTVKKALFSIVGGRGSN